jgi:hypothetical protein
MPVIYNDWTDVKIMPLDLVVLTLTHEGSEIGGVGDDSETFQLYNPEAESSYSLAPITQSVPGNRTRTVAWRMAATVYVPYNNYETMRPFLGALALGTVDEVSLWLKPIDGQAGGAEMAIAPLADAVHGQWSGQWKIEPVEYRPRLIIEVSAILKRDAVTRTGIDKLFAQVSGF